MSTDLRTTPPVPFLIPWTRVDSMGSLVISTLTTA